ncbi:Mobile element protein [Candidatus Enterovibrio altilux]|uniref:Mobile element protein n=1 Tax=Candidatus Enterovibrio altilux TaxID=1927128 RepID=A0A291BAG3_9GAMM|nr:Mobile element protein [Candidatus Enterovibrio luxaltus]
MDKFHYNTANKRRYEKAVINCGSLTFWIGEEAMQLCNQIKKGNHGRSCVFSGLVMMTACMAKRVFEMRFIDLQGFINFIFKLT